MTELSAVVQSFYDNWGAGRVSESRALFTDDAVIVTPAGTFGIDANEQMGQAFMAAFPDSHMDLSRMVSAGDGVWVTGSFRGTQTGDLVSEQGAIPASGEAIDLPFAEVFTIRGGRIARQDLLGSDDDDGADRSASRRLTWTYAAARDAASSRMRAGMPTASRACCWPSASRRQAGQVHPWRRSGRRARSHVGSVSVRRDERHDLPTTRLTQTLQRPAREQSTNAPGAPPWQHDQIGCCARGGLGDRLRPVAACDAILGHG